MIRYLFLAATLAPCGALVYHIDPMARPFAVVFSVGLMLMGIGIGWRKI